MTLEDAKQALRNMAADPNVAPNYIQDVVVEEEIIEEVIVEELEEIVEEEVSDEEYEEEVISDDEYEEEYIIEEEVMEELLASKRVHFAETDKEMNVERILESRKASAAPQQGMLDALSRTKKKLTAADWKINVASDEGLEVVKSTDGRGRIVRATQDLKTLPLYSPLLRERPALICERDAFMEFMERFQELPQEIQVAILDMYCQPLHTSYLGKSLLKEAKLLYMLGVSEDLRAMHKLLCILCTNRHTYDNPFNQETPHSALSIWGSKFSHACHPNAAYSATPAEDGCLEYLILTGIAKGEEVTTSYLADLFETPTHERRQELWEEQSFLCQCNRCAGPDYLRCLPCPSCEELMPCTYSLPQVQDDEEDAAKAKVLPAACQPAWKCPHCQEEADSDVMVHQEQELARLLQMVERQCQQSSEGSEDEQSGSEALQEMVTELSSALSSTHYLNMKALRQLVGFSTAEAFLLLQKSLMAGCRVTTDTQWKIWMLIRGSVVAGIELVLAGECAAANCTGCYESGDVLYQVNHSPQYDRATPMKHVGENLMQLPVFLWPSNALVMVHRYLPTLDAKFHSGMMEVTIIEPFEKYFETMVCLKCNDFNSVYWTGKNRAIQKEEEAPVGRRASSRVSMMIKS